MKRNGSAFIMGLVLHALRALADVLMPRFCLVCGKRLLVGERKLCLACLADIPYTLFEKRSRNPMADKLNSIIAEDVERKCEYSYATALFLYSNAAGYRHIPHQIKYHSDIYLGEMFGRILGDRIASSPHFQDIDAIIPVPLHWTRQFARGYNQAEIIAKEIARQTGKPLRTDLLFRCRRTKTQTKLNIQDKSANVSGAFAIRRGASAEGISHALIVDDTFTTGSTVYSCYKILRTALPPPSRISVACLCYVG